MQSLRKEVELRQRRQHQERNRDYSQVSVAGAAWDLGRRLKPTPLEGEGKGKSRRAGQTAEADEASREDCGGDGINAGL